MATQRASKRRMAEGSAMESGPGGGDVVRWEGNHEWRISGFPTLWQRGKKHYSDVFTVGGCPWRLSLYPKGNTAIKGSRDHVAVYLEAADAGSAPVGWRRFVEFKLAVVNKVRALSPLASPLRVPSVASRSLVRARRSTVSPRTSPFTPRVRMSFPLFFFSAPSL